MQALDGDWTPPWEQLGESAGHPFSGNQWKDGESGTDSNAPPTGDRPDWASEEEQPGLTYTERKAPRKAWEAQMTTAVTMGTISEEDAKARGWWPDNSAKFEPLPPTLYHVTTSASGVEAHGLLTRDQLGQGNNGAGLGGGVSNLISFTDDLKIAESIERAMVEGHQVATGEITPTDIIERARTGADAESPYLEDVMRGYKSGYKSGDSKWQEGDPLPRGIQDVMDGARSWTGSTSALPKDEATQRQFMNEQEPGDWQPDRSTQIPGLGIDAYYRWTRPATEDEQRDDAFALFKTASLWRDQHGGPLDPLFFNSDVKALAALPAHDIGIVTVRPSVTGAQGTRVSALGEWRTIGKAVEVTGVQRHAQTASLELGESAGHPFRGNQYRDGEGSGDTKLRTGNTHDGEPTTAEQHWTDVLDAYGREIEKAIAVTSAATKGLKYTDPAYRAAWDQHHKDWPEPGMGTYNSPVEDWLVMPDRAIGSAGRMFHTLNGDIARRMPYVHDMWDQNGPTKDFLKLVPELIRDSKAAQTASRKYDNDPGSDVPLSGVWGSYITHVEGLANMVRWNAGARQKSEFGESAGHPFRGNQWKAGEAGDGDTKLRFPARTDGNPNDLRGFTYNRDSAGKILAFRTFNGSFAGLSTRVVAIRPSPVADTGMRVAVNITNETGNVGTAFFNMDAARGTMSIDAINLSKGVQGKGFAAEYLDHVEKFAANHGIDKVTLFANISVGGYAWAKAGYDWAGPTGEHFSEAIAHEGFGVPGLAPAGINYYSQQSWNSGQDLLTPSAVDEFRSLQGRGGNFSPLDVAMVGYDDRITTPTGREMWAGKHYMLTQSWDGVKDITYQRAHEPAMAASAAPETVAEAYLKAVRGAQSVPLGEPRPETHESDYLLHQLTIDVEDPMYWATVRPGKADVKERNP